MTLMDAIAEAQVHVTQAQRGEREADAQALLHFKRFEVESALKCMRSASVYGARAEAWARARELMVQVARGEGARLASVQGGAS